MDEPVSARPTFLVRHTATALAICFFLLAALLTRHGPVSWNDSSRMATIDSLVERHTFAIDGSSIQTGDKYRYDGKFYSDKPAMLAVIGTAVALGLKVVGISLAHTPRLAYWSITVLVVGLSYAIGLAALYSSLRSMSIANAWAACVTTAAGAGTLLLPYATMFNNHVVSGALVAIGFALALRPKGRLVDIAGAGAAFALAASIDIAFAIFLVLAPILLVRHGLARALPPFLAAGAPIVAAYFAFNVVLSGSLMPPAMNVALWQYPGSEFNASNLSGLATHRSPAQIAYYGYEMLFGRRGLFIYMPILILSTYGLVRGLRTAPDQRATLTYIAATCALYVAMYVLTSNNYSGWSYGVRWYAGIVYLAIVPLGLLGDEIARSAWLRVVFVATTCASIGVAVVGLVNLSPESAMPIAANIRELAGSSHHLVKIASLAAFTLVATLVVAGLAGIRPRRLATL